MISAIDHYQQHDQRIDKLSEFREAVAAVNAYAAARNLMVFWRGQMDYRWGLQSSLARQLSTVTILNDSLLNKVEDQILKEASEWIDDLKKPTFQAPLARLGYLQHHGIPSRLIDFTRSPWIALFFAAEAIDEYDGRIFALLVQPADVIGAMLNGTPWRTYKSDQIKIWDPIACGVTFPRLAAQDGVLALGRLPSTRPHRTAYDGVVGGPRSLLAEEVRSVLSVPFKLCSSNPIPPNATLPIGLTFRIHVNKESIRRDLAKHDGGPRICQNATKIDHKLVYPDTDGMRTHSSFLTGLSKKTLILP